MIIYTIPKHETTLYPFQSHVCLLAGSVYNVALHPSIVAQVTKLNEIPLLLWYTYYLGPSQVVRSSFLYVVRCARG